MTERELLAAYGIRFRHCAHVKREHALALPCQEEAIAVFKMPDGVRIGFCERHRKEGAKHAEFRGWQVAA